MVMASSRKDLAVKGGLVIVCVLVIAAALYAGLVRSDAKPVPSTSVSLDFRSLPNGDIPTRFSNGDPATNSNRHVALPDRLKIVDGAMTFTPEDPKIVAGYFSTPDLQSPVTRMGADWVFRAGKGTVGAVALVVSRGLNPGVMPPLVAPLSVHLVITTINWNLSVQPNSSEPLEVIGQGFLKRPLSTDGKSEYQVSVRIDEGMATIALPDGETATVKDPRISQWQGNFATFELFSNNGVTDAAGAFHRIWAASGAS